MIGSLEIKYRITELCNSIAKRHNKLTIISILDGAVIFTADLLRGLHNRKIECKLFFVKISSYGKEKKTSGNIQLLWNGIQGDLEGEDVLIIDDIVDSGKTLEFVTNYVRDNYKANSISTCVLIDKPTCRIDNNIKPTYSAFQLENQFVYGYGLDLEGMKRGLPYITWDN